ncbi:MAG: 30S ribosomal protein S13, partial [Halobacteriaceae archaeon]
MSTEEPTEDEDEDIRYFVRIGQTDLDGTKSVERSLAEMDGVGRRTARIIADEVGIDRTDTLGRLADDEIDAVVDLVENYAEAVPDWLANRRRDYYSGETTHETGNDLSLTRQQDINRMQMIR